MRDYLTIKEAKSIRCDDPFCNAFHFTCRRCKRHLEKIRRNPYPLLCRECGEEYKRWHHELLEEVDEYWKNISDDELKEWQDKYPRMKITRDMMLCPPYFEELLTSRIGEWLRTCPVIEIRSEK